MLNGRRRRLSMAEMQRGCICAPVLLGRRNGVARADVIEVELKLIGLLIVVCLSTSVIDFIMIEPLRI